METNKGLKFKDFFSRITNTEGFGSHIERSIPGYAEWRARSAFAAANVVVTYSAHAPFVFDVGASEGQWGATINQIAPQIVVVDIDPNPDMLKNNVNPDSFKENAAWVEGFEDDGKQIPAFNTKARAGAIGMHMVRQFVTRDGSEWYGEAKKFLNATGVFFLAVKVIATPGKEDEWKAREKEKDAYKSQFFTEEEMSTKKEEVLVGMHELMMTLEEEKAALAEHFKFVEVAWHSANFVGFIAGNDENVVKYALETYNKD